MVLPKHFEESRPDVLQGLIESPPLADEVTAAAEHPSAESVSL